MRTEAKLCHLDQDRCVVLVEGFEGISRWEAPWQRVPQSWMPRIKPLPVCRTVAPAQLESSSNGKSQPCHPPAQTVNQKEQQAIRKHPIVRQTPAPAGDVKQTVVPITPESPTQEPESEGGVHQQPATPMRKPAASTAPSLPPNEAPTDPDDWSEELTAIDLELQRIGWDRDQERIYLERAFGHGSRHRLTRFNDLVAYLKRLRDLPPGSDPQQTSVPLRRSDLLQQSDEILRRLEWHQEKAIEFLKQNFQATSRQQLSDEQLLTFNMLLEEQLVASPGQ